jgi:hypothetical protein
MRSRRTLQRSFLMAALALVVAPATLVQAQAAQPIARPAPATAAEPKAVTDLASALAQTAAVVEATVAELRDEYRDAEGPWTRVVLGDVKVHAGSAPEALELWQFGGVLPNGRLMVAAELPAFVAGKRYLLFLRNTAWNVSPIVGQLALRVEQLGGVEVLVTSDGQAVTGLDASGAVLGASLFSPAYARTTPAATAPLSALGKAQPMDRARFLAALGRQLAASKSTKISGVFLERPAGRFQWRGQRATPPRSMASSTSTATSTSTAVERDASGDGR